MASPWMRCLLPPRMILDHSRGKCVHQIDISVRCIGWKQKVSLLQIQFYCPPPCASLVFERAVSQRCRINGLPDLVYYWASLKGGKKRAPDFDWWVPLSSQITAHPSPFSHRLLRFLFSWEPRSPICPDSCSCTSKSISELPSVFGFWRCLWFDGVVLLVCVSLCRFALFMLVCELLGLPCSVDSCLHLISKNSRKINNRCQIQIPDNSFFFQ